MTPTARRRLLLVHAHPDDETITTGGTIARYAADPDTHVTLLTCTLGEQGEVMVPAMAGLAATQADQLGGYRIAELAAAAAALGLTDHRMLGGIGRWRDSGMVITEGIHAAPLPPEQLHPRAFTRERERAAQVDALLAVLDQIRPQVVVGYDPGGGYGHPDHVRAHEITMAAAARCPSVRKIYWTVVPRSDVVAGLDELSGAVGNGLPWRLGRPDRAAQRARRTDHHQAGCAPPAGCSKLAGVAGARHPADGVARRRADRLRTDQRDRPAGVRAGELHAGRRRCSGWRDRPLRRDRVLMARLIEPVVPVETNSDRITDLVIMTVLIIDTVLLALLELAFASFSVGVVLVPVERAGRVADPRRCWCAPLVRFPGDSSARPAR